MAKKCKFKIRSLVNRSAKEIFDWHVRPRVLERSIPPYEKIQVLNSNGRPEAKGSELSFRVRIAPFFWTTLSFEYAEFKANEHLSAFLKKGLLRQHYYEMKITPQGNHTSEVIDGFEFVQKSFYSSLVCSIVKKYLVSILEYKHQVIDHDIGMLQKYPFKEPLKILISGSHGLIGKEVAYFLEFAGHDVWQLSRQESNEEKSVCWNPRTGECQLHEFEGFDVVIHLAGESIGKGWWTKKKKKRLIDSRAKGTENLVQILKKLKNPPQAFICASAVGYYGNRGDELVNEASGSGKGLFITEICEQWERAGKELEEKGVRVAHTRFGVVLSSAGGALKKMLFPFKWGLGGKIGDGHQYVSWVAIDDVVGALYHVMMTPTIHGAVNVVSPNPVPNDILAKKLAKRLKRWVGPPLPELVVRLLMGQKGKELLLTSTRAEPRCLLQTGYMFHYPELTQALKHVI
ncbi:TIGR01777 family oxidoreductase [Candidatus Neptunochlamydia vexilliferae]|nr:TIGR01777 family oxidoreductase [Candidatus Neptunochlamydia vexilliferae]